MLEYSPTNPVSDDPKRPKQILFCSHCHEDDRKGSQTFTRIANCWRCNRCGKRLEVKQ